MLHYFHLQAPSEGSLSLTERLQTAWILMQTHVNMVMDSDLNKLNQEKLPGIKQVRYLSLNSVRLSAAYMQ